MRPCQIGGRLGRSCRRASRHVHSTTPSPPDATAIDNDLQRFRFSAPGYHGGNWIMAESRALVGSRRASRSGGGEGTRCMSCVFAGGGLPNGCRGEEPKERFIVSWGYRGRCRSFSRCLSLLGSVKKNRNETSMARKGHQEIRTAAAAD